MEKRLTLVQKMEWRWRSAVPLSSPAAESLVVSNTLPQTVPSAVNESRTAAFPLGRSVAACCRPLDSADIPCGVASAIPCTCSANSSVVPVWVLL